MLETEDYYAIAFQNTGAVLPGTMSFMSSSVQQHQQRGPSNPLLRPLSKLQKLIEKDIDEDTEDVPAPSHAFQSLQLGTSSLTSTHIVKTQLAGGVASVASGSGRGLSGGTTTSLRFSNITSNMPTTATSSQKRISNVLLSSSSNLLESDYMLSLTSPQPTTIDQEQYYYQQQHSQKQQQQQSQYKQQMSVVSSVAETDNSFTVGPCDQENNDLDFKVKQIASDINLYAGVSRMSHNPSFLAVQQNNVSSLSASGLNSGVNLSEQQFRVTPRKGSAQAATREEIEGISGSSQKQQSQQGLKIGHLSLNKRNSFPSQLLSSGHHPIPLNMNETPALPSIMGSPSNSPSMYTASGIPLSQQPSTSSFKTILKKDRMNNSVTTDSILDSALLFTQKTQGRVSFNDQREVLSYEEGAEEKRTTSQYDDILFFDEFEDDQQFGFQEKTSKFYSLKNFPPTNNSHSSSRSSSKSSRVSSLNLQVESHSDNNNKRFNKSHFPSSSSYQYEGIDINDIISNISDSPLFSQKIIPNNEDIDRIKLDHSNENPTGIAKGMANLSDSQKFRSVHMSSVEKSKVNPQNVRESSSSSSKTKSKQRHDSKSRLQSSGIGVGKSKFNTDESKLKAIMDRIRIAHPKEILQSLKEASSYSDNGIQNNTKN